MTDLPAAPDIVLPTPDKRVTWTQRRLDQAAAMWKAGRSGLEIAVELGTTRSAAIGKLFRLGLRRGPKQNKAVKASNAKGAIRPKRQEPKLVVLPLRPKPQPKPEVFAKPIALIDLKSHHCRWPVAGAGATTLFCGGDAHAGRPYCAAHCRMAYQRWGAT
jgi:GcrA cell cycle regulator